tara:strand:+ start:1390 stop:2613 length:1224 start_codon:yes stop_codon:yes gene_type:complete
LGAGLAGLGLSAKFPDAECFEREIKPLGHARSYAFDEVFYDQGAHICHSKNPDWIAKLNIENAKFIQDATVKNFDNGVFFDYPVQNNLCQIDRNLASEAIREVRELSAATNQLQPLDYLDWCRKTYGATLTEKYYNRFTKKYWRSHMCELGTYWLGGRLIPVDLENIEAGYVGNSSDQSVFKSYYYPKNGGFENLFSKILNQTNNRKINFSCEVHDIFTDKKLIYFKNGLSVKYDQLYSTIPLVEFVRRDNNAPHSILERSQQLLHTSLFLMVAKYKRDEIKNLPDWFYVYDEDIDISRVFNLTNVSEYVGEYTYLQYETFRRSDESYNEKDVFENMKRGAKQILSAAPINFTFKKVDFAYVVPTLQTPEITEKIISFYRQKGINFHGLYGKWNYIWSDAAYFDGLN